MQFLDPIRAKLGLSRSATVDLMLLNVLVFLLTGLLGLLPITRPLVDLLRLKPEWSDLLSQPWSLLSYIFLHAGFMHLLGNMLWLFFIGTILEDLIGRQHLFRLFLLGGLAGGILFVLCYNLIPVFSDQPLLPMVGASGGVTAIIVAAATFRPTYTIYLFGVLPIQLRWIALFRVFTDLAGLGDGMNDGGQLAHIGGASFGLLYALSLKGSLPNLFRFALPQKTRKPKRSHKVWINTPEKGSSARRSAGSKPNQDDIDAILDKINKSGYQSLSEEEKQTLFRASSD
jgi:membrane associated rhomboid family serine protease